MVSLPLLSLVSLFFAHAYAQNTQKNELIRILGPQGVNLVKLGVFPDASHPQSRFSKDQGHLQETLSQDEGGKTYDFRAQWFEQPLDHFAKHSGHSWHQRFWVNSRHYKPGTNAPVIVIDGGETSGEVSRPAF
jgi:hypothetical protein